MCVHGQKMIHNLCLFKACIIVSLCPFLFIVSDAVHVSHATQPMTSIFSRHGIPRTVVSDNGPQYNSAEMKDFASSYRFKHVTSSPYYPQWPC